MFTRLFGLLSRRIFEHLRPSIEEMFKVRETQLRADFKAELAQVGAAISETRSKIVASTSVSIPDRKESSDKATIDLVLRRLSQIERILEEASKPVKPGNHIRPGHTFGNEVRL